jgi:hypothetical protein
MKINTEIYKPSKISIMKKVVILIFLIFTGLLTRAEAQTNDNAAQVLKKCIDLPGLQKNFPTDNTGNLKPLRINYWHPVLFPIDISIEKDGKPVQFNVMSSSPGDNGEAYFLFKTFSISGTSASIAYEYHYDNNTIPKVVRVKLELTKSGTEWEVTDSQITDK